MSAYPLHLTLAVVLVILTACLPAASAQSQARGGLARSGGSCVSLGAPISGGWMTRGNSPSWQSAGSSICGPNPCRPGVPSWCIRPGAGNTIIYNPQIVLGWDPWWGGFFAWAPPLVVVGPGGAVPVPGFPSTAPLAAPVLPLWEPAMPQLARLARPVAPDVPAAPQQPRTVDHELVAERILLGDRMFRAKNFPRAVQRYEQALKENPRSIEARLRLAQVAIERDRFREAIEFLSEAQEIDPRWLTRPDDVQALYKEPNDYARLITRLESHLQAHPDDRDAWLVLGAQLFFTGRTVDAADAFLRLTDRRPDELLQAFLDQTEPVR